MSALSKHNPRTNSVASLITKGLGYCCEWFFFSKYHNCETIADRLGVTSRAIRNHKAAWRDGEMECEGCASCMKDRLPHKP